MFALRDRWWSTQRHSLDRSRRNCSRPRLEILEERMPLNAGDLDPSFGTGGKLVAHNATTGRRLWTSGGVVQGAIYNAPAVIDGMVYVGSWDGRLYAFGGGPRRSAPVAGRAR